MSEFLPKYMTHMYKCMTCKTMCPYEDMKPLHDSGMMVSPSCIKCQPSVMTTCDQCKKWVTKNDMVQRATGRVMKSCISCRSEYMRSLKKKYT